MLIQAVKKIDSWGNVNGMNPAEAMSMMLLALSYGAFFFLLNLLPYVGQRITRSVEWAIFLAGWVTVPLLSLGTVLALHGLKRRFLQGVESFYSGLAFLHLIFWACAIWSLYLGLVSPQGLVLLFVLLQLLAVLLIHRLPGWEKTSAWQSWLHRLYAVSPLLLGLALLNFTGADLSGYYPLVAVAALGLTLLVLLGAERLHAILGGRILDALVIFVLILLISNPQFTVNPSEALHLDFYMGPVNDLLAGKSLLVNVACQYGVLVIYFLAAIFKSGLFPPSWAGLSFVIEMLYILQFAAIYFLLKAILKRAWAAILALGVILVLNYFATMEDAVGFPSIGPLRFGLVYLLLVTELLRNKYPKIRRLALVFESIIVGLAFAWSFETCIYVVCTFFALVVFEGFVQSFSLRDWVHHVLQRFGLALLAVFATQALLTADVYLRSGQLPNWEYYFEYLVVYGLGELGAYQITLWSPWVVIVLIYFGSLIAMTYQYVLRGKREQVTEGTLVFGLTAFGIMQFTYFLGRSHPNNLYHISVPAIFVVSYWIVQITGQRSDIPRGFRFSFLYVSCYALLLMLFAVGPQVAPKLTESGLYSVFESVPRLFEGKSIEWEDRLQSVFHPVPSRVETNEVIYLVKKYAPDKQRIQLYVEPDIGIEALMLTRKGNIYAVSDPIQDDLTPSARRQAMKLEPAPQVGDILFLSKDGVRLHPLQRDILGNLCRGFYFTELESTAHGYHAVRLDPAQGGPSDCIARYRPPVPSLYPGLPDRKSTK